MKTLSKIALIYLLTIATIKTTYAQGLYANVGAGYNFAAGRELLGINTTASSTEGVYGSYGKGISPALGVGFMFGEHVGAEVSFSYLLGGKHEFTDNDGTTSSVTEVKSSMLRIIPAIKVTAGETVKPYAKFGIVIGASPKIKAEETGSFGLGSFTREEEYTGGSSLGFLGAIGADFEIAEVLAIFVELNTIAQSWGPNKVESTEISTSGGASVTEVETLNFEDTVPDNSTGISLKTYFPFSSVGLHAGIKLMFGGN